MHLANKITSKVWLVSKLYALFLSKDLEFPAVKVLKPFVVSFYRQLLLPGAAPRGRGGGGRVVAPRDPHAYIVYDITSLNW